MRRVRLIDAAAARESGELSYKEIQRWKERSAAIVTTATPLNMINIFAMGSD